MALRNRWALLALLFATRLGFGMQFQSVPPLTAPLVRELGLSYTQLGMLIGVYMLAGTALALPGGLLGQRLGERRVLVLALSSMVLGNLAVGVAGSFAVMLAGRLLAGAGAILMLVQHAKIVTDRFAGRELATAMSILLVAYPLGIGIALLSLGPIAQAWSWRVAMQLVTGILLLCWLAQVALYRESPAQVAGDGPPVGLWALSRAELCLIALAGCTWMFLNASYAVTLGFTPALLLGRGYSVAEMGLLLSLPSWITIISMPLGGHLVDRMGRAGLGIVVGTLVTAFATAMIAHGEPVLVWMILTGIAIGMAPGSIMSLPAQVLAPANRNMGFGVFYTVYYAGMAVFPPVAGWLSDATGTTAAPIWFSALLMAMPSVVLLPFYRLQRHWAPPATEAVPSE